MTLLEDIQTASIDQNCDLGTILRKCKLLAVRVGSQPLESWINYELNGYPPDIPVPNYRIWSLEVKGHFAGPFGSGIRNAPIPLNCIPKESRNFYKNYECRQSVVAIESLLQKNKTESGGTWTVSTRDLAQVLGNSVYQYQNCVAAWAEFSEGSVVEVLNTVRNRILDFTIAVMEKEPGAGEATGRPKLDPVESGRITQIFNTTVYGGAANLVGSASETQIEFNISLQDFSSLARALKEMGVNSEDIDDLKTAIDLDTPPSTKEAFGPKVSQWIAKMVNKAAEGSWNIGIGAAGSILAQAIAKFYGL